MCVYTAAVRYICHMYVRGPHVVYGPIGRSCVTATHECVRVFTPATIVRAMNAIRWYSNNIGM